MTLHFSLEPASGIMLGLLTLLATTQLVENRIKLSRLEEMLALLPEQVAGASVRLLPDIDSVMDYLVTRTESSKIQIDQASIDLRRSRNRQSRKKYEDTRLKVIKKNRIKYRYIGRLDDPRRLAMSEELLASGRCQNFFSAFYTNLNDDIPLLNFVIFDNKEVITRYPFDHGKETVYVVISGEVVAKLFSGYFDRLWERAKKADCLESVERLKREISGAI